MGHGPSGEQSASHRASYHRPNPAGKHRKLIPSKVSQPRGWMRAAGGTGVEATKYLVQMPCLIERREEKICGMERNVTRELTTQDEGNIREESHPLLVR